MKKLALLLTVILSSLSFGVKAETYDESQSDLLAYESYYDDGLSIDTLIYYELSISDLYGYNCYQLRLFRNAIYAYYGYIFKDKSLKSYFSGFWWYTPRYTSQSKVTNMMSRVQKHNIEVIKKREKQLGC